MGTKMTLLKNTSLILVLMFGLQQLGSPVYAQESTEQVTNVMLDMITKLQQLVASVQLVQFDQKRQSILQQGLTEVQLQLDLVHASLVVSDITTAKQQLERVDALKKQYHKKRSPSLWQLLFGSD